MPEKYSTPLSSPLYSNPPYHYVDAKIFIALFYPSESSLKKLLPSPLRPSQLPLATLLFGEQPCKEIGTFMESGVLAQCLFDNKEKGEEEVGVFFSHNYVDTDKALAAGREIWGYPRKLANIEMDWKGDTLTASTSRDGTTLLKATCTFDEEGEWIDSGPNVNVKMIPNVTGQGVDIAALTAAYTVYTVKNGRSGDVTIEIQSGPNDDFSMIEIESEMIGLYFDTDILVPPGNIITELKD